GATKWEYRILTKEQVADLGKGDVAVGLNRLGEQGWELAAIEPAVAPVKDPSAQFYLKRPTGWDYRQPSRPGLEPRVEAARANLDAWKERAAWSKRMAKKGLMSEAQADADRERLQHAARSLEQAERELKALPAEPQKKR